MVSYLHRSKSSLRLQAINHLDLLHTSRSPNLRDMCLPCLPFLPCLPCLCACLRDLDGDNAEWDGTGWKPWLSHLGVAQENAQELKGECAPFS